jgi:hypothetical protein
MTASKITLYEAFLVIGMFSNLSKSSKKKFDICSGVATKRKSFREIWSFFILN